VTVCSLNAGFLHSSIDQPDNTTTEDEKIADLKLLNESFLDRTETAAAEQNADKSL
jgi:hypothetical protein